MRVDLYIKAYTAKCQGQLPTDLSAITIIHPTRSPHLHYKNMVNDGAFPWSGSM